VSEADLLPPAGGEASQAITEFLIDLPLDEIDLRGLTEWTERLVKEIAPGVSSLAIRLTDAATVQSFNERFRGRAEPTDVLSFPGERSPEGLHLGDILIAVPVAGQAAKRAGHALETELRRLILHGALHCLGYDHEVDDGEMNEMERELRLVWVVADA